MELERGLFCGVWLSDVGSTASSELDRPFGLLCPRLPGNRGTTPRGEPVSDHWREGDKVGDKVGDALPRRRLRWQIIIDRWSGMADYTGMPDHSAPDYEMDEVMALDQIDQLRALFEDTRLQIIDLLSERAATTSELAEALERPKGTIGHHLGVLAQAGLVKIVRTEKVRAIEAKYYGRTARHFNVSSMPQAGIPPDWMLTTAARELAAASQKYPGTGMSTVRYARIPEERAREWQQRLEALVDEFVSLPREGETAYGLAVGLYPTDRPRFPQDKTE